MQVEINYNIGDKFDEVVMGGVHATRISEIYFSVDSELKLNSSHRIWFMDKLGNHASSDESYLNLKQNKTTIEFEPKFKIGEKGLVYHNYMAGAKVEFEKVIGYGLTIKQGRFGNITVKIEYHTEHSRLSSNAIYKNQDEFISYLTRDL